MTPLQIKRVNLVVYLYGRGWSQAEIATAIGTHNRIVKACLLVAGVRLRHAGTAIRMAQQREREGKAIKVRLFDDNLNLIKSNAK